MSPLDGVTRGGLRQYFRPPLLKFGVEVGKCLRHHLEPYNALPKHVLCIHMTYHTVKKYCRAIGDRQQRYRSPVLYRGITQNRSRSPQLLRHFWPMLSPLARYSRGYRCVTVVSLVAQPYWYNIEAILNQYGILRIYWPRCNDCILTSCQYRKVA